MVEIGIVGVGNWGRSPLRTCAPLPSFLVARACDIDNKALLRIAGSKHDLRTTKSVASTYIPPRQIHLGVPARYLRDVPEDQLNENQTSHEE